MNELVEQRGMSFESALSAVKDGMTVQRQAWEPINGIQIALSLHGADDGNPDTLAIECQLPGGRRRVLLPYIAASSDLLADDWIIVR